MIGVGHSPLSSALGSANGAHTEDKGEGDEGSCRSLVRIGFRLRDRLKRVGLMQIEPICPLFIERGSLRGKPPQESYPPLLQAGDGHREAVAQGG
ncbi:hypothetical protein ANRL4_04099 [Anaerolineae bacterium]|nr:hypothetical protein ANRL4_04099 [Anaerolineae bacterium]